MLGASGLPQRSCQKGWGTLKMKALPPSLPPNSQDDRTRICNLGNPNPALYQLSHALLFFLLSSRYLKKRASMPIPTETQMKFCSLGPPEEKQATDTFEARFIKQDKDLPLQLFRFFLFSRRAKKSQRKKWNLGPELRSPPKHGIHEELLYDSLFL